MTERRGADPADNFWAWRKLMYRFLDQLTPEDIEAITAFVQMEMLEAGYAASAEFHYLHHQTGGAPYEDIAELSARIVAAAEQSGIGLTLLPVHYEQGGCDGRALGAGQVRFGNNFDAYAKLYDGAKAKIAQLPDDANIGVAPHSLRAVSRESLKQLEKLAPQSPFHIHIAEQIGEVDEVTAAYGARPVEWLYDNYNVDERWCLIHATQMQPHETEMVAKSKAVVGLCPMTEANLGDGIFDGVRYLTHGGRFGMGSDSNIRISLCEELRLLEYSQRLQHKARAVLATEKTSTGRVLFEGAAKGGAQAAGRNSGVLEVGRLADLMALNVESVDIAGRRGDSVLDSFIFAGDKSMITDVWAAGRHLVKDGRHKNRSDITSNYQTCITSLKARL
jgi:formimidoylglutamate deiminase